LFLLLINGESKLILTLFVPVVIGLIEK